MDLRSHVLEYIRKNRLIERGDRILLGLSGGADSVCLAILMKSFENELGINVFALHVNHSLRGEESDGDEIFCKELCERLDIPFEAVRIDVTSLAKEDKIGTEAAARKLRYEAFKKGMEEFLANKTATAHNRNDQAETVLFRFLRGSSSKGLSGIRPVRDEFIRPLLSEDRKDIEAFLEEIGQDYRTDSTNLTEEYTRNSIRLSLIPLLKREYNPDIIGTLYETAEIMASDSDYLEKEAEEYREKYLKVHGDGRAELDDELFSFHKAMVSRVILRAIEAVRGNTLNVERKHIEDILELSLGETGKSIDIPDLKVRNSYGKLIFEKNKVDKGEDENPKASDEIRIPLDDLEGQGFKKYFKGYSISLRLLDDPGELDKKDSTAYLNSDGLKDAIILRTRRNGDKIRLKGIGGRKSIKSILIDKKTDRGLRDRLPVITTSDGEIIYLHEGILAEDYYCSEDTKRILCIKIEEQKDF